MQKETQQDVSGVYLIQCLVNGKNYIGSSKHIKRRWRTHVRELDKKIHHSIKLQEDWIKYGEDNFKFEILLECSHAESRKFEMEYIEKFNSNKFGYNVKDFKDSTKRRARLTESLLLDYAKRCGYEADGNSYWFDLFDTAKELNINPTKLLEFFGLNSAMSWTITFLAADKETYYGICWDNCDGVQVTVSHESFFNNPNGEIIKCF